MQRKTLLDYYNEIRDQMFPILEVKFVDGTPCVPYRDYERLLWVIGVIVDKVGGRVELTDRDLVEADREVTLQEDWERFTTVITTKKGRVPRSD